jgi:hypothetical protein
MIDTSPFLALALCLLLQGTALARAQTPASPWQDWQMVVGDWIGDEGHGQPGSPLSSSFSFSPDLDGSVLIRRDRADYPALQGRPAFTHAGLMVIYRDDASKAFRADSFDNEGHVIEYAIDIVPGKRIVFTSSATIAAPTYRLVYETAANGLAIRFEIAPPNRPSDFSLYVAGSAHRK